MGYIEINCVCKDFNVLFMKACVFVLPKYKYVLQAPWYYICLLTLALHRKY